MEKNNFYFQGKMFEKEEDFWKWVKEWKNLPLDEETAERILSILNKEIIANMFLLGIKFTNSEFNSFVEKLFKITFSDFHNIRELSCSKD